jgi:AcrR family transcriptional regulator
MELKDRVIAAGCYLKARSGADAVTIHNVAGYMKVRVRDVHHLFPNDRLFLKAVIDCLSPPSK